MGEVGVRARRRGDDDGVHLGQQLAQIGGDERGRVFLGEPLPRLVAGIADGRELGVSELRRRADVVAAPRPCPDDAEPQPGHR